MQQSEIEGLAAKLVGDFRTIEPHLRDLDKHLTLRTYVQGYSLSDADKKIWQTLRGNKVAMGFVRKGSQANITRWFTYLEQAHPELQEETKAADAGTKAKSQGANYNLALQDTDKGVVTRFLPEPS